MDSTKFYIQPLIHKVDSLRSDISHVQNSIDKSGNYLDPIELIIVVFTGILTGVAASVIYAYYTKKIELNRLSKQFSPLSGKFIRWWEEDKEKGGERVWAKATIKYFKKNRLLIEVETFINYGSSNYGIQYTQEQIERWKGEIVMDTVRSGTIIWDQVNPKNGNNGFKRIIVEKNNNGITLVGESDRGFGVEKFTERESYD